MNEDEFAELAAGYALDALSPDDLAAFEAARAAHPEWEHWVRTDAETAASLADSVTAVSPPAALRDSLLARVAQTPQHPAAEPPVAEPPVAEPPVAEPPVAEPPVAELVEASPAESAEPPPAEPAPTTSVIQAVERRRWTRAMVGLAASLVFLVALGFGAVTIGNLLDRPPAVVALDEIEAAPDAQSATAELVDGGTATAHWSESVGKAVLVSDGLPAISDDESFELWFVRDDSAISAGVFDVTDGTATAVLDGAMQPGDAIAVTVEPAGGSPAGEPTSDPIVVIPTA